MFRIRLVINMFEILHCIPTTKKKEKKLLKKSVQDKNRIR